MSQWLTPIPIMMAMNIITRSARLPVRYIVRWRSALKGNRRSEGDAWRRERTAMFGVWRLTLADYSRAALRIVIAITGASGVIYTQRLLAHIDAAQHEIHLVLSHYAHQVIKDELPEGLRAPANAKTHGLKSMNVPFVSGSNPF